MILGVSRLMIYMIFTNDCARDVRSHINAFCCKGGRYLAAPASSAGAYDLVSYSTRLRDAVGLSEVWQKDDSFRGSDEISYHVFV